MSALAAVYTAYDAQGDALYVGMSSDVDRRLAAHRSQSLAWWGQVAYVSVSEPMNRAAARRAEREQIAASFPRFNKQYRTVNPARALLTTVQVAAEMGVTAQTARRWIEFGQLRAIRLPSGVWRVRRDDLDALLSGAA